MNAFMGSQDVKRRAMQDAALARMGGHYHAWGHYWHHDGGKCRGNVTGAVLHTYMKPEQIEQDLPDYWEPVMGIPWAVAELIDTFFSGLSLHENKELHTAWAETVLGAINPGADLSRVPMKLAAYILEKPDWLAAYAGETVGHQAGMMHGIILLQMNGIDQVQRVRDFYNDHMHKLHRHQLDSSRSLENAGRAALHSLCIHLMEQRRGPLGYMLQHAVEGSAAHKREPRWKRWVEISQIFIQIIEDSA